MATKAAKRAALYHRVSTVDQNPAAARKELRDAAKHYGLQVALDIEETGSGANNDRPGLGRTAEYFGSSAQADQRVRVSQAIVRALTGVDIRGASLKSVVEPGVEEQWNEKQR